MARAPVEDGPEQQGDPAGALGAFPREPLLLPSGFEPIGESYVVKPFYSREGRTSRSSRTAGSIAETGGEYTEGPRVYQEFRPLAELRRPVPGRRELDRQRPACGMGLREDDGLITRNTSRFVPHLFRRSPSTKPPMTNPKRRNTPADDSRSTRHANDPLWDPWLDR